MTDSIIKPETEKRMRDLLDRTDKSMDPIERKITRPLQSLLRAIEKNKQTHGRLEKVAGKGRANRVHK